MNSKSSAKRDAAKLPLKEEQAVKQAILGKEYELSTVYAGNTLIRRLNRIYRNRDESTNVLAFPLSKNSGEIFLNLTNLKGFSTKYLFIHALLHLKGMQHGAKMERAENKFLKLFNGEKHLSRNRRRQRERQSGNRRRGA